MNALARILVSIALLMSLSIALSPSAKAQAPQPASADLLKSGQLDQLVAPIALYPDTLLAEILMAATYPLEVVSADRWVKQNKSLKGEQLKAAAEKQGWDKSVVSLTATPDVLGMMSEKLDWTQQLGDAVLAQQADVMDAIQRLRVKAQDQKKLASTKEQTVTTKREQNKDIIVIEPAVPDTIYVPYYDPGGRVWPVALAGLSALLLSAARLHRGRRGRDRHRVRGRLCRRALGLGRQLLGRRRQLGRQHHQREPPGEHQQHQRSTTSFTTRNIGTA